MLLDERISALIADIYTAPYREDIWQITLGTLKDLTNSRFVLASVVDLKKREYAQTTIIGPDDSRFLDGMRDYGTDLYRDDPLLIFASRNPTAGFVSLSSAAAQDGVEFAKYPYMQWLHGTLRTGDSVVRYTPPRDGLTIGVSLHPSVDRTRHSRYELRLFEMLFEHIKRATQLAMRPADFDRGEDARLLINAAGQVQAISDSARAIIAQHDGLHIIDGHLRAARSAEIARLDELINSALRVLSHGSHGGELTISRPSGRRNWLVLIDPLPGGCHPFGLVTPTASVRIVDPEAAVRSGSSLRA